MKIPNLRDYVGQEILIFLVDGTLKDNPDYNDAAKVKLVDVENAGIWIESLKTNRDFIEKANALLPPILFVPFSQLLFVSVAGDYPLLSPKLLGFEES